MWHEEFDANDYTIPHELLAALGAKGWIDTSWHNDVCPSFSTKDNTLRIWVDAENPARREIPRDNRFAFNRNSMEGDFQSEIFATDSLKAALDFLSTL